MSISKTTKIIFSLAIIVAGVFGYYFVSSELNKKVAVTNQPATTSTPVVENVASQVGKTATTTQTQKTSNPTTTTKSIIVQNVPFSPQAPFGQWSDLRQEDGCEEMSAIMAMRWVNKTSLTPKDAETELFAISDFETKNYGYFEDTSAQDTVDRIFKKYFAYDKVSAKYGINADDIINELKAGNLVIVPVNGKAVGNPNYSNGGPDRHNMVIKGYDISTQEFITNDPGTRKGENYRYAKDVMENALRDYPSGISVPITDVKKAMIIVKPK